MQLELDGQLTQRRPSLWRPSLIHSASPPTPSGHFLSTQFKYHQRANPIAIKTTPTSCAGAPSMKTGMTEFLPARPETTKTAPVTIQRRSMTRTTKNLPLTHTLLDTWQSLSTSPATGARPTQPLQIVQRKESPPRNISTARQRRPFITDIQPRLR